MLYLGNALWAEAAAWKDPRGRRAWFSFSPSSSAAQTSFQTGSPKVGHCPCPPAHLCCALYRLQRGDDGLEATWASTGFQYFLCSCCKQQLMSEMPVKTYLGAPRSHLLAPPWGPDQAWVVSTTSSGISSPCPIFKSKSVPPAQSRGLAIPSPARPVLHKAPGPASVAPAAADGFGPGALNRDANSTQVNEIPSSVSLQMSPLTAPR